MINKSELLTCINKLLESAKARNTNQGIKVYEGALKKISEASTEIEIEELAHKLKHALAGIEAHGYFTEMEFEVVRKIRNMG